MFVIGLTGGIGSGKSAAATMFEELGAAIVDTDAIAHELTAGGGGAIEAIRGAFGVEFITADGALDRARMRELAFRDRDARKRLEAILHPMIRAETAARIARSDRPYVIVVVPLLLETGAYRAITDRVLVVDSAEVEQVRRASQRSGMTPEAVRAVMAAQLPRTQRLAQADDIIANSGGLADLKREVEALHEEYLELSRQRGR